MLIMNLPMSYRDLNLRPKTFSQVRPNLALCCHAGENKPGIDREQMYSAGVDVFVTRHLILQNTVHHFDLDICFGSRHDAGMNRVFL